LAFAEAGCRKIAITDINDELLKKNQQDLSAKFPEASIIALPGDITNEGFIDGFVAAVVKEFGRLDYCVLPQSQFFFQT
jgi:NAD(P)-dependent dehydrogenase (short-subunit alcohol dehydrogenase family)